MGWTIAEHIIFSPTKQKNQVQLYQPPKSSNCTAHICRATSDGCVLGIEKEAL